MRSYKKVVMIIALSLIALIILIAVGISKAMTYNKANQSKPIVSSKHVTRKSSQMAAEVKQTEKEFATQFLTDYTNYSDFDDYKEKLKPSVTNEVAQVLNFDKVDKNFGSSSSSKIDIYEGDKHQYFGLATQSLNNGLNIPMAVMISVDKSNNGFQVSSIYEPSLRGVAVDYIKSWSSSKDIGITPKNSADKSAEAFLRNFNNFSSLNTQKSQIKPFLTSDMQEKLAVNVLGSDTSLDSEIDRLYLFKGVNNSYVGLVQVNLSGEKSNQVIAFKMQKSEDKYLVSELNQPTRQ